MTSFNLNVDANYREVAELLGDVGDDLLLSARVVSTNKALSKFQTAVRKDLAKQTGIPSKEVGKRFKIYKANFKKLHGRMFIGTMPFSAYKLGVKKVSGRGTSKKAGLDKNLGQKVGKTFLATMKSGHTGVFYRTSAKRRNPSDKNHLPIREHKLYIDGPARFAANMNLRMIGPEFERIFAHEFNFRTGREIQKRRLKSR